MDDVRVIWKYMDLAKFISLLSNNSLYFACPIEFNDPYEGHLPVSHIKAIADIQHRFIEEQRGVWRQLAAQAPNLDLSAKQTEFDKILDDYIKESPSVREQVVRKFGVSCWHQNQHESEAMWRIYSAAGQGIAIESTVAQLYESILLKDGLYIDDVRYADFQNDPIIKGHKHYGLMMKRKSFEHEKEIRALKMLPEEGKGMLLKCDINVLINRIHISPYAPSYFQEAVEFMCKGQVQILNKPIIHSDLLKKPAY